MSSKKPNKNIFGKVIDSLISDTKKKKISESVKGVKKEFNKLANEYGYQQKNLNSSKKEIKNPEEALRKNLSIIMFFEVAIYILIIIGGIILFSNDHIFLGILALLLIPIIFSVTVVCSLKYIKTKYKKIYDLWGKKFKKIIGSYGFVLVVGITFIIISFITMIIIVNTNITANKKDKENFTGYEIKIHIDFNANWIFSKYDVLLYTGKNKFLLEHGKNKDIVFYLEKGTHTLNFENDDNSSIKSEVLIEVDSNMEIGYSINCYSDRIDVKNLYIDIDKPIAENEIKIDFDKSRFKSESYNDVINTLKELGFTNINEKPLYDIVLGFTPEGAVESVMINGLDNYKRGNIFDRDTEIMVSYHLKQVDDPSRVKDPYANTTAEGINYKEVENAYKEAGFKNIKLNTTKTSYTPKVNTVFNVSMDFYGTDKPISFDPETEVEIWYYIYEEPKPEEPRSEEVSLSNYGAKKAFENYGKAKYKYGFKCHWIINLIDAQDLDDGSIYYKVGVTITNQYGASYSAIAEGVVSGTDVNPKITNFKIIE